MLSYALHPNNLWHITDIISYALSLFLATSTGSGCARVPEDLPAAGTEEGRLHRPTTSPAGSRFGGGASGRPRGRSRLLLLPKEVHRHCI